ncbi:sulfate transporter [Vitreoscilla sp. C1]|uniref:SulP family inorganic anion transporter n=1 Tax=Vitreoscilla sp. (strain C1) TaxID=96942 RepID=UPI000CDC8CDA|nr:SulP family inorganic anion transporter [Vitreoscilla sp. C1]AUZ05094.1 sulfate transporter [Vitreoscilla sp. C1]
MLSQLKTHWFSNIRADVLSGLVVGLALIPESIAFSIIAGVDPKVGLYASICIAITLAFAGGRPAMISAATGAVALLVVGLVKDYGLQYLLAATVLAGILQIVIGYLKLAKWIRFVSKSVVTGFLNALSILIFMAQLPHFVGADASMYVLVVLGLLMVYGFAYLPKIGKLLPAPLVSIVLLSILVFALGIETKTVGDMGSLPDTLPVFLLPNIPFNWETFMIILPYSLAMAVVGLLESMMTATVLDDITQSPSDKFRECKGQGMGNIVSGMMGGMAGCAMIGQSLMNVQSGARTRLSTFSAGVFLLVLVVFLGDVIALIPMAALVAVMFMVAFSSFDWASITQMHQRPLSSNIVMVATVLAVLATHNLAVGVLLGVVLSALFLMNKLERQLHISATSNAQGHSVYSVEGAVFFSSVPQIVAFVANQMHQSTVVLDFTHAHIHDLTSVQAMDDMLKKWRSSGKQVSLTGLNPHSLALFEQHATEKLHQS